MHECFPSMCVCVQYVCNGPEGQKMASRPLELELQMMCAAIWVLGIKFLLLIPPSHPSETVHHILYYLYECALGIVMTHK